MSGSSDWWLDAIDLRLSQGDVLTGIPIGVLPSPVVYLRHATGKGNVERWDIANAPVLRNDKVHFLATGKVCGAVVLSHSCELDKDHSGKVLVAPILSMSAIHPDHQVIVMQNANFALMPVPEVPGLGDHFADLRSITSLPRAEVDKATRISSMTPAAIEHLRARVTAFFTRLELPST